MAFERRDGFAGSVLTKYADTKFTCCPFCGSKEPHWWSEAIAIKRGFFASGCINEYKFQCEKCKGVIALTATGTNPFAKETFTAVKIESVGSGHMHADKVGKPLTINELKDLCKGE